MEHDHLKEAPPREWREARRLRAFDLHERGWTGAAIAEALGVTGGAVSQWLCRARSEGGRARPCAPAPALAARRGSLHNSVPGCQNCSPKARSTSASVGRSGPARAWP